MPNLLKYLARHLVQGIAAGWITLVLLMATNTGGLWDVVFGSANPLLPLVLLAFGFTITFGSLSMGAAIMLLPYDNGGGKDRGRKIMTPLASLKNLLPRFDNKLVLVPIRVKDKAQHTRFHR